MKKLIIMPTILITPILFGCQKNKSTYSFTFHSDYCTLDNKSEYSKKEPERVTLTMELKEDYKYCALPDDIVVLIGKKEGVKDTDYFYTPNGDKATLTLTVTDNISVTARLSDSDNNFRIDPNKYEEAIGLTGKDIKYVQRTDLRGIMASSIYQLTYFESYVSPTVYNEYSRNIYSQYQSTSEHYVEKASNKYYRYDRDTTSSPWEKTETTEDEFYTPSKISIKSLTELGNITYDLIKDKYNKDIQSYEFETENEQKEKYDVVMSFYNNQVTFLSYSNYDETTTQTLYFETINFTYREITPTLPKVN